MARDRLQELKFRMSSDEQGAKRNSVRETKSVQNQIEQAHEDLVRMQGLVEKLGLLHLESVQSRGNSNKLDSVMDEIRNSAQRVKKVIEIIHSSMTDDGSSSAVVRMKRIQLESLTTRFSEVMDNFRTIQLSYREKCKERIKKQFYIMGHTVTDEEVEQQIEATNLFVQESSLDRILEEQRKYDEVKSRQYDIKKLEQSMIEMRNMFIEISDMVNFQGQVIVRIEDQIGRAVDHATGGQQQLALAEKNQSAARKKKIWIVGIIIIALAVIVIIIATVK